MFIIVQTVVNFLSDGICADAYQAMKNKWQKICFSERSITGSDRARVESSDPLFYPWCGTVHVTKHS